MKRTTGKMLHEFRTYWKNYVFQSLLATAVIFIVLLCLSVQKQAVIIASIGATTFIVFAMPNAITAQPRNIIGGHLVGVGCGLLAALVLYGSNSHCVRLCSLVYAGAVGLSIFIMVVTDTEHPPASGTALGVAIQGFNFKVVIAVLASAVILSLVHTLFKRYLKDLT